MNDGMLSQEEIDALLKVSEEDDAKDAADTPADTHESIEPIDIADYLSDLEIDTLGEIGNISFGSSATALSTLMNQKVDITTPTVSVIRKADIAKEFDFKHVSIRVNYVEGFFGQNILVIKSDDAAVIADVMLGGDGTNADAELNDIHISAVQEAMNQMMGSAATSMSTVFDKRVDISPPSAKLVDSNTEMIDEIDEDSVFIKILFQLKVGTLIDSNIMQLIPMPFAKNLAIQLLNGSSDDDNGQAETETAATAEAVQVSRPQETTPLKKKQSTASDKNSPQFLGGNIDPNLAVVQQADFSDFDQVELNTQEHRNLDMLLDIPLKVTVELGRTKRTIKDILDLSSGSIIELDKLAGEPVDILVNEKLIAKGEVVVIDENFGVRVTDIISQSARLMNLK